MNSSVFIHDSATVDHGAKIGAFTSVWHFSHIEPTATVGENCNLGQNTYIGNNAIIGNACRLGNSVSVFNNVEIEDFVFCAPFMVFTHIGYPRAAITRKSVFQKTLVKTGATLGANSTIVPGVTVGQGGFIGAGSVLTKSCKDWALMVGVPARQVGWVSAFGERIPLAISGNGHWKCNHTDDMYVLSDGLVVREPGTDDILLYRPGVRLQRRIFF